MTLDPVLLLALLALLLAIVGVVRLVRAWQLRQIEVLSRDETRLASDRLGLSGRPDRLIRLRNGAIIPQEKKSSKQLYDSHRIQIGAYLLLVEDKYGIRPPYGVVELGDGSKTKIPNTRRLRRWTLDVADKIRAQRVDLERPARVRPTPAQCRSCGYRDSCAQRVA